MKRTSNYGLYKPEGTDPVDISNFNDNADIIDEQLKKAIDSSGEVTRSTVEATTASVRANINSGESLGVMIGKIMKWFADLKGAAFVDVANNDTTTKSGYVADARIVKTHGDEIDAIETDNFLTKFGLSVSKVEVDEQSDTMTVITQTSDLGKVVNTVTEGSTTTTIVSKITPAEGSYNYTKTTTITEGDKINIDSTYIKEAK